MRTIWKYSDIDEGLEEVEVELYPTNKLTEMAIK